MHKFSSFVITLFSLVGVQVSVQAQPISTSSSSFNDVASNSYLGLKAGWSHGHDACEETRLDCDNDDIGGGAFVGYNLNDWLAIEAGYLYLGKTKATYSALDGSAAHVNYSGKIQGLELSLKPYWSVNDNVQLFTKLGMFGWWAEVKGHEVGYSYTSNDEGVSLLLGSGISYRINDNISLQGEYQWVNSVGGDSTGDMNLSFLSVGVAYHFGQTSRSVIEDPSVISAPVIVEEITTVEVIPVIVPNIYFDSASSKLDANAKQALQPLIQYLKQNPNHHVKIHAYTDNQGDAIYNQRLSEHRAASIAHYLLANGVDDAAVTSEGYGDKYPIADNMTKEGRARNRRVMFTFE